MSEKKQMTNKEIREHLDKVYKDYRFSKERKHNVEMARRANRVTPEELSRRFIV